MRQLDVSTIFSILLTLIIVLYAITYSGKLLDFVDIPSMMLVLIGTLLITIACFSFTEVIIGQKAIFAIIIFNQQTPQDIAANMLKLAEFRFKFDLGKMHKSTIVKHSDKFFIKYLNMLIDQENTTLIAQIMEHEIDATSERYINLISIVKKAAEIAPSMGLVGTIIGLIQMLGSLNDIKMIGPAMAMALLTTFYGAILSYVILFPIASKMEKNLKIKLINLRLYAFTINSLATNQHPTNLEATFNSILPANKRVTYF